MSRSSALDETMSARGLISAASAAEMARVSPSTIYRWAARNAVESESTGLGLFIKRASLVSKLGPTLCKMYGIK